MLRYHKPKGNQAKDFRICNAKSRIKLKLQSFCDLSGTLKACHLTRIKPCPNFELFISRFLIQSEFFLSAKLYQIPLLEKDEFENLELTLYCGR